MAIRAHILPPKDLPVSCRVISHHPLPTFTGGNPNKPGSGHPLPGRYLS